MVVIVGGYTLRPEDVRALLGDDYCPPVEPTEEDEEPISEDFNLYLEFKIWYGRQPEEPKLPIPNCFHNENDGVFLFLPITVTHTRDPSFRKPEVAAAHALRDHFLAATSGNISVDRMVWHCLPLDDLIASVTVPRALTEPHTITPVRVILGGYIIPPEDVRALLGDDYCPPVQPTEEGEEPISEEFNLFMEFDGWYSHQPEELKLPIPNCFYNENDELVFYLPITVTRTKDRSFRKPEVAGAHAFRERFLAVTAGKFSAERMVWHSLPADALVAPLARIY